MSDTRVLDPDLPIWRAIAGLLVGYGIVLGVIFVAFFLVPYLLVLFV